MHLLFLFVCMVAVTWAPLINPPLLGAILSIFIVGAASIAGHSEGMRVGREIWEDKRR